MMQAIVITGNNSVAVKEVPAIEKAAPGHVIIRMEAMGINGGDVLNIAGSMPRGFFPKSQYDITGVSGAGTIVAMGEGVPEQYRGKKVAVYRSLQFSDSIVGTWSEYAQLHYLQCVILPNAVTAADYAGSLVNIITPYAFWQTIQQEGHKGIIATAGNSATGLAMLGICQAYNIPLISIVRNEAGKQALEALGATHVLLSSAPDYTQQLQQTAQQLQTTAVFDGVGGAAVNNMLEALPANSTVYCYGFVGGATPVSFPSSLLMKGLTLRGFSNFKTATVQHPQQLEAALADISNIIGSAHFTTKAGRTFSFEQIQEALAYAATGDGKAILTPFPVQ